MDIRARRSRETSPDRAKVYLQPKIKPFRKVQILYYLCRNGQLEHPHFMEVSHLVNQQLRLKDVMDRLTVLRGKGMPSLFSWSCKRSYKNGYVWNDLSENDVIYPAEGAEYVLKGSEIIEGCAERFQHLQISNVQQNTENKRRLHHNRHEPEDVEEEEKTSNTSSSYTRNPRCSRGVSTDDKEENSNPKTHNNATELTLDDDGSPPSSSSTISEKAHNGDSQRFEDGDSAIEPVATRNSVLLQLIACGSVAMKGRNAAFLKGCSGESKKSKSLHRGLVSKTATKLLEEDEISCMSENPRFGNPQSEEKEYFSGSIVETMTENRVSVVGPSLQKSSSYKEERGSKCGMEEAAEAAGLEKGQAKGLRAKCIPRKRSLCTKSKK